MAQVAPTLELSNWVLLEGDAADAIVKLKQEDGPELRDPRQPEPSADAVTNTALSTGCASRELVPGRHGEATVRRRHRPGRAQAC